MAKKSILIAGSVALVLGAVAASTYLFLEDTPNLLRPNDPRIVAQGQKIYQTSCASCHGKKLEGQSNWKSPGPDRRMPAPPHDDSGHTWHHSDQILFDLTKLGLKKFTGDKHQSNMPTYETVLRDEEIIAVLSFIKSQWPDQIRQWHDKMNEAVKSR